MSKNKTRTKDKYRVVYNDTQRIELENEFRLNEYIAIPRKQEIAHKLQLSERQIKIWFQNRRAKKRKQQKRRQSAVSTTTATNTTTASPGTATPISVKHESVSPPYTNHHNNITSTTANLTTDSSLKSSPQLIIPENRLHHHPESIYPSRFFNQPPSAPASGQQQQAQSCASQYYESATNYLAQEQEQYSNATCIQTNHQRQPFGPSWPTAAPTLPTEPVVSRELASTSPPTNALGSQHFHHQSHHLHHHPHQHHQQSIQRYSHQNATNYSASQADGYGVTTSNQLASPMAQTMHRLHTDSSSLHQHFISHQMPQGPAPLPHHQSPHLHAQHHTQHYHQPLTQVQSQNHLHHHHNQLGMSSSCNGAINI